MDLGKRGNENVFIGQILPCCVLLSCGSGKVYRKLVDVWCGGMELSDSLILTL